VEVLDDDLHLLADVGRVQLHPPHQPLPRSPLLDLVGLIDLAGDLQRSVVGLVAPEHIEDVALLDRLPHRVEVELDRLGDQGSDVAVPAVLAQHVGGVPEPGYGLLGHGECAEPGVHDPSLGRGAGRGPGEQPGGVLEAERAHRAPRRIRWPLRDRETDTRINRVEAGHASNIEAKCHHQRAPKRHRSIDAEASPMSRYMTSMYGLCDASGHR
jgi:hypothetical protein